MVGPAKSGPAKTALIHNSPRQTENMNRPSTTGDQ